MEEKQGVVYACGGSPSFALFVPAPQIGQTPQVPLKEKKLEEEEKEKKREKKMTQRRKKKNKKRRTRKKRGK